MLHMYRVDISLLFIPLGKYFVDMSVRLLNVAISQQGWFEGVIYLLRKGARQSIAEKSGRTPLHASTYDKDVRYTMCRLTISTGESNYSKHCHIQHLFNPIPKLFAPFFLKSLFMCMWCYQTPCLFSHRKCFPVSEIGEVYLVFPWRLFSNTQLTWCLCDNLDVMERFTFLLRK